MALAGSKTTIVASKEVLAGTKPPLRNLFDATVNNEPWGRVRLLSNLDLVSLHCSFSINMILLVNKRVNRDWPYPLREAHVELAMAVCC